MKARCTQMKHVDGGVTLNDNNARRRPISMTVVSSIIEGVGVIVFSYEAKIYEN